VNHVEAINKEFSTKADAASTNDALKLKADVAHVNDLQARLERLEALVTHAKEEQATALQALADKTSKDMKAAVHNEQASVTTMKSELAGLRGEHKQALDRTVGVETRLDSLSALTKENRQVTAWLKDTHEKVVLTGIKSLKDQLGQLDAHTKNAHASLESLTLDTKEFRKSAQDNFKDLRAQAKDSKEQQEFLSNAMEMMKRKSRELNKTNTSKLKELSDEQEKFYQQMAAFERSQKTQEREVRRIDARFGGGDSCQALGRASPETCRNEASGDRLTGVMSMLEKIAAGAPNSPSPSQEHALALIDAQRPALPWFDHEGRQCAQGLDLASLPRFQSPAPHDSCPTSVASTRASSRLEMRAAPRSKSARSARK
jgi:DNA repair exonuclease SbcCD ATPase subunit